MATSEYCSCPPRLPTPTASHVAIASGVNHRVTSPRWTSARSYAGQFPTRYFVLYLGCTLDFTSRSCPFGRHDGQGGDEHLFPRTNAPNLLLDCFDYLGNRGEIFVFCVVAFEQPSLCEFVGDNGNHFL